jgi:hypothetical protein
MKFDNIPIFWLKTLAEGIADSLFYKQGVSDAEEALEYLNEFTHLIDPFLVQKEIELIKSTEYFGSYKENNIFPEKIKFLPFNKNRNNIEELINILQNMKFYERNLVIFNIEKLGNNVFFQIAFLDRKTNIVLNIYSVNLEILENFFYGSAAPSLENREQNVLISLINSDTLKNKIIVPLLNALHIRNLSEPTRQIRNALNFFQHTDLAMQLKKGNTFVEIKPYLRKVIISNEIYELKFLTYLEILEKYKNYLSNLEINNYVFLVKSEEPWFQSNILFLDFFEKILSYKEQIKNFLLTFGDSWFQNPPKTLIYDCLISKIVLNLEFLCILPQILKNIRRENCEGS